MKSLTAFLDASVILAGLASPADGSAKLFLAAKLQKLKLTATPLIINETRRHLDKLRLKPRQLEQLLERKIVRLIPNPPETLIKHCLRLTADPDDAHVLAGAILSSANFLLSLDKKHLVTAKINHLLKPLKIKTPQQFWQGLV